MLNDNSKIFTVKGINTANNSNIVLAFGLKKASGSATADNFLVETSTDGSSYTKMAYTMPEGTDWQLVTVADIPSSENLCIRFTPNGNKGWDWRLDDLLLTGSSSTPMIDVIKEVDFAKVEVDREATQTITVKGANLTEKIAVSVSGDYFSASPDELETTGGELTVTYAPTVEGTHEGTITLTSGTVTQTISLKGQAGVAEAYKKISSLEELTDGYYMLLNTDAEKRRAMSNVHNGTYLDYVDVTPNEEDVIMIFDDALVWKIETNGSGKTIYNEASAKYVSYEGDKNNVQVVDEVTANNQRWNITYSNGEFLVQNMGVEERYLKYNTNYPRFACYKDAQENIHLYKKVEEEGPSTGIAQVSVDNLYAVNGTIYFNAAAGERVEIINTLGQCVYAGTAVEGLNSVAVETGIVVVKVGNQVGKVVVK